MLVQVIFITNLPIFYWVAKVFPSGHAAQHVADVFEALPLQNACANAGAFANRTSHRNRLILW